MTAIPVYQERFGPAARRRLGRLVAEAKAANPLAPVTVVTPHQYAGISLRRTLANGGGDGGSAPDNGGGAGQGLLNVRFMAGARLAEFLGGPALAAAGRRPLTPLVELAMIRAVAAAARDELAILGRVAHHPALHRSLAAAFNDLARLDADGLARLADSGALASETVQLYRRFRERTGDYYQSEELALAAAAAVRSGAATAVTAQQDIGAVIFHLPADPSPGQRELLRALAESGIGGCRLLLGLTGETETDEAAQELAASFTDSDGTPPESGAADRPEVERHPPDVVDTAISPTAANPVDDAALPAVDGIVSAPDVREEVRRAVRDMLQLARREGVPFHRMAALYRYAEPYAAQLRLELRLAGLPIAGPEPDTLQDTAAGRLLLGLLEALLADFSRPHLMQWLAEAPLRAGLLRQSSALPESAAGRDADGGRDAPGGMDSPGYERRLYGAPPSAELAHWEALSRKAGVIGGLEQWVSRVPHYRDNLLERIDADRLKEEFSPARRRAMEEEAVSVERLIAFVQQLAARHPAQELAPRRPGRETAGRTPADDRYPWGAFSDWALRLFRDYALPEEQWPESGGHAAAFKKVEEKLKELAALAAVEPAGATFPQFRQALEDALKVPAGRSGATGSGVFAAPLSAALGMEFDAVWVLGMAEGAFPGRLAEDPLLPDAVRLSAGGGRLPLRRTSAAEERRLYLAALAAGRRRFLSYARTGQPGRRAQHPAPWLLDAATALNGGGRVSAEELDRPAFADAAGGWLTVIQSPQSGLDDAADGRAADAHEFDLSAVAQWRKSNYPLTQHPLALSEPAPAGGRISDNFDANGDSGNGSILGRALRLEESRNETALTDWDGYVAPAAAASPRLSRALTRTLSPTRLERWAVCPYRFFLADVLSLSALEPLEELLTISPMERGSLVHRILERFIKEAVEQQAGEIAAAAPWTPARRQRLFAIAETEFQAAAERGITGHRILWAAAKDEMRRDLQTFLDKDGQWRAAAGVRPYRVEWRFGEADGPVSDDGADGGPVALTLPDGSAVNFRGVIDRVDLSGDGGRVVVLDYKSGGVSAYRNMDADPLDGGARLQLPVYALAARSVLPLPNSGGGASDADGQPPEIQAAYWFVSDRGGFQRKEFALNSETQGRFGAVVGQIVGGIRQGVFPANPGPSDRDSSQNCRYCDFQRVCPTDRRRLWERKQGSPQATPYLSLAQPNPADDDDAE